MSKYNTDNFDNFEISYKEGQNVDVHAKIKAYIDDKKISQIELCEKTHIAPAKLCLTLNGRRKMTFSEYQTICWALGVSVDTFMEPRPPEGICV